jgi:hypothetical protein
MQRLEAFGFEVIVALDAQSLTEDALFKELIVNSSTVNSGNVGTKFRDVTVPVVNWEQANLDDFLMTGDTADVDRGTLADQSAIEIVNADHPLAGGLAPGAHEVTQTPLTVAWGHPGANEANAIRIATVAGDPARWAIFAYEKDSPLVDGTPAPARRVHLFMEDNSFAVITDAGLKLFDAAISWAVDRALTPPIDQPALEISSTAAEVRINWTAAGFRLQQTTDLGNPQWTDVPGGDTPPVTAPITGDQRFFRLSN